MILNPKFLKIECVLRLKFPCFFLFNVNMHISTFSRVAIELTCQKQKEAAEMRVLKAVLYQCISFKEGIYRNPLEWGYIVQSMKFMHMYGELKQNPCRITARLVECTVKSRERFLYFVDGLTSWS